MRQEQKQAIYLKDYQASAYCIDETKLTLKLFDKYAEVQSTLSIRQNSDSDKPPALVLDGDELELKSVSIDGRLLPQIEYQIADKKLIIPNVPAQFELSIEVVIQPHLNTALSGLYLSKNNYCTQCESHGFQRITYYLDRPDVMSVFTTRIEADKHRYPYLLSNGNPIKKGELGLDRHYVTWHDPFKKPAYLFALVAGDFAREQDSFVTMSGRQIDLQLYLEQKNAGKGKYAMQALKQSMQWDEETYGREYDLDIYMIVAVSDFNMGAMENKGLNIFNDKYIIADEKTATDADYQNILAVVAHEYFHNWSGNRVTLRDWFQLSLKEGFTVFREQSFMQDVTSRAIRRIEEAKGIMTAQFAEDASPMSHPVRPQSYIEMNNFYTATVYSKGAEVIGMMHTLLGPEKFRKACDYYFEQFDGFAATTDDFVECMQKIGKVDLSQFKLWYDQSGTPELTVTWDYDEQHSKLNINFKQFTPATADQKEKQNLHIPIRLSVLGENGKELIKEQVYSLKEQEQTLTLSCAERGTPSLLRNFSAPLKLRANYTTDELLFLAIHDDDGLARYEAGQSLAVKEIFRIIDGGEACESKRLSALFSTLLDDDHSDPALLAYMLRLPSEAYLAEQRRPIAVDAIVQTRQGLQQSLAIAHANAFKQHYIALQQDSYSLDQPAVAQRALRNACLYYFAASDDEEGVALAERQYFSANNMTDKMAALLALNDRDSEIRELCLTDFFDAWEDNALVMDKWLALQATSRRAETISRIEQLAKHQTFSYHNPNKVYSLFAQFGHQNFQCFHDATGKGYSLIADTVIKLDSINPQVAARVIRPLISYRQHEEHRQKLMREALLRISKKTDLSADVYEIVNKSL
jgi:aminopeptidase N